MRSMEETGAGYKDGLRLSGAQLGKNQNIGNSI